MKAKRFLIPVTILLVLFAVAPVMAAPATKTPFTAHATFIAGNISPGTMWARTTELKIIQIRGITSTGNITGDISGSVLLVADETFDMSTGLGLNHGELFVVTVGGTYEGSFQSMYTGLLSFTGTFVARGTDTLEGQILIGSYEGELTWPEAIPVVPPVVHMTIEGVILST